MKLTKTTAAKVVFSLLGVACLTLAGVTAYNYATAMEAYALVTIEPVDVDVWVENGIAYVNVTYRMQNPSRADVEIIWAQALVRLYDRGEAYDFSNSKYYGPGEAVLEAGGEMEIVMKGYVKQARYPDVFEGVINRTSNAEWSAFCSLYYKVADYEFSTHRYDGAYYVRED